MARRALAGAAAVIATVVLPALPAQAATGSITGIAGKCVDNQKWNAPGSGGGGGGGFVVSESQFNSLFPGRNGFYTYSGLVSAMSASPAFATTGSDTVKKQEAAAFLANVAHETGNLVYVTEIDKSGNHCDASQSYGCPAGTFAYYGRGPIQLSWNFNYQAAGDALGINLLGNPHLVEQDSAISWKTGLWYWMTQTGPGSMTGHNAMGNGAGFGRTIRSINGSLECDAAIRPRSRAGSTTTTGSPTTPLRPSRWRSRRSASGA